MRYKFRGKRLDNKEWVYGYVAVTDNYPYDGTKKSAYIWKIPCVENCIPVTPSTVGQFTNLTDKNGKEIYEGDIVHCQATFDNANMVVIFEEGEFHMVLCENYKDYIPLCGFYCIRNFTKEVIGNIHDNPELLEATAKEEMTNS